MTTPYSATEANLSNDERDSFTEFEAAVNDVIETLINGVHGFETASAKSEGETRRLLEQMATQRRNITEEMIRVAADENMNPVTLDDEGTPSGVLHRSWISIRDAVQGDDGVTAAASNGEQHAKEEIEEALDGGLPQPITTIAQRALEEIESNISKLESLAN